MSVSPRTITILISNWPQTQKFSQFFFKIQAGKTFSYHGHVLVTLHVQLLCSDWLNLTGEFMRKIYAASWKLLFDSWSWQSFESTCDVFNCLFPLDVKKWTWACDHLKTGNLSADNLKKILDLDGSTPEPAIRSSDTGQRVPCFNSCQLMTSLMCNQLSPGLPK